MARATTATFRQIHLDFHTSEQIPVVGDKFDPSAFAETLRAANVDSILCFARCHHGWLYYDSDVDPDRKHPGLDRDLLREQIDACHAAGIRVPIYTTVQWDMLLCEEHPEWRIVHADGRLEGTPPFEPGFYRKLCLNSPFREWMKAHARDIIETLGPVDGLYFDFIRPDSCVCRFCRVKMERLGLDPSDEQVRLDFGMDTVNEFERELTAFVRTLDPNCSVTYNGGHIGLRHRDLVGTYTHFELETLPSGGWGYMYFPATVRYARTLGPSVMGTTGKFHTTWGDFHSLKNEAALEFECFRMLALGAKCCIGDQLLPSGVLDPAAYDIIGRVFGQVAAKEPWCVEADPATDIGVLHPEEFLGGGVRDLPPGFQGVTRMLDEAAHQFDVVDTRADLSRYSVLVLPDYIPVSSELNRRLQAYLDGGGAILATFASGMDSLRSEFTLTALGVRLKGQGPTDATGELARGRSYERNDFAEYLVPEPEFRDGSPSESQVMYSRGMDVEAIDGSTVLARVGRTFFDRSWRHFSSHLQAPWSGETDGAAIVQHGSAIYISQPVFTQYERNAPLWCKTMVINALKLLLPEPLLQHDGPSTVLATVSDQPTSARRVVHLLHYIPERRGAAFDTIEDVIPLHDLSVSVRTQRNVVGVSLVPQETPIAFEQIDRRVSFEIPVVRGHQMVVLQY